MMSTNPIKVNTYENYEDYIKQQLKKKTKKNMSFWTDEDYYNQKTKKFIQILEKNIDVIKKSSKSLSVGSRVGNEVLALQSFNIESIGVDLYEYKNLVIKGDMHDLPFENSSFDLVFSNILDHSLFPDKFFKEVFRVLKNRGHCILHVVIGEDLDEFSTFNFFSLKQIETHIGKLKLIESIKFSKEDFINFTPLNTCIVLYKDT